MLSKVKQYTIVIVIIAVFCGISVTLYKKLQKEKARSERLTNNIENLLQDKSDLEVLNLTQKEATGRVKRERDSIAHLLSIKPSHITQIIEKRIIQRETINVEVPVTILDKNYWKISDKGDCFLWEGDALLESDSLFVNRTLFEYGNKVIDTYYWKRKFWIFSKKKFFRESVQTCGESKTFEVNFVKK